MKILKCNSHTYFDLSLSSSPSFHWWSPFHWVFFTYLFSLVLYVTHPGNYNNNKSLSHEIINWDKYFKLMIKFCLHTVKVTMYYALLAVMISDHLYELISIIFAFLYWITFDMSNSTLYVFKHIVYLIENLIGWFYLLWRAVQKVSFILPT